MNTLNVKQLLLALLITTGLTACGSDVGGNEDKTNPSTTLTSLNGGEEVIGTFNLTWATNDPNPSTVDIFLSSDSGVTYPTIVEINVPDTGSFNWDSNTVDDCRNCRIKIIPQDVVGNTGASVESAEDFIINNVPQVLGVAYYSDLDNNGFDAGDEIRVPFDKALEIRTSIANDIFFFPVLGDNIGAFSKVRKGTNPKELIITMNDIDVQNNYRLHIQGAFKPNKLGLTFPSGINLQDNISAGIIFSPDTGRTAAAAEMGVDILPAFSDSGQTLGNKNALSITLGDIDGDGDLDIVTGNGNVNGGSSQTVIRNRVWINGGDNSGSNTGVFTDSGQELGDEDTLSIALGDIDGDGDLDIVTGDRYFLVNFSFFVNRVWINGGDNSGSNTGVFTSGQTFGSAETRSIALGDVDGDSDLDIVTGNIDAPNRVWINGGNGSGSNTGVFSDSGQMLGNKNTQSIALGDVDNDGDLDIVAGNFDADSVWINGGNSSGSNTGIFTDSNQTLGSDNTLSIALGDVDGDSDLDIVTGNINAPNRVWINGGNGSGSNTGVFSDSGQMLGNKNTQSIALGDVDNDGDLDIVAGNLDVDSVWINGGNSSGSNAGIFTDSNQTLGSDNTLSIALGDIDGDGDIDIMALNSVVFSNFANIVISLNSLKYPSAPFIVNSNQALGNENTRSLSLGDIDGDGDLDIVAGNLNANRIWINGGDNSGSNTGVFTDSGQILGNKDTQSIALGDIDGDGDLDIVVGNDSTNRVWINGGDNNGNNTGVFTDSDQILGNDNTLSITLGDIDGDGDLDIVTGNSDAANRVWINGGDNSGSNTGVFTDSGQALGSAGTLSITLGDVDDDSDLDIVVGNFEANRVWINGGNNSGSNTGVFTDSGQVLGNAITLSIALGDVDNDGDLDIVTGNIDANRVWINGGDNSGSNTGVFTDSDQVLGNASTLSITLGDIDGDGDIDIVTGSDQFNSLLLQLPGTRDDDLSVWINGGDNSGRNTGKFTKSSQNFENDNPKSITLGDIDGDGDLDIVTGHIDANRIWLNDF